MSAKEQDHESTILDDEPVLQSTLQDPDLEMGENKSETPAPLDDSSSTLARQESNSVKKGADETQVILKNNLGVVFTALCLTVFLAAMDQTIVATALPTIVREIGTSTTSASSYSYVGTAYLLAAACLSPLYGKLSDIVGRKPVFYASILTFLLGSALCGAAQSLTWLAVCRGIQGIGGGGILQLTQIVISDIVPLASRGKYSGIIGAVWGVSSILGPLIGGAITTRASWRYIFFINLPSGGIALVLIYFNLNLTTPRKTTFATFLKTFDFSGLFIFVCAIIFLIVGIANGETGEWLRRKPLHYSCWACFF